MENELNQVH